MDIFWFMIACLQEFLIRQFQDIKETGMVMFGKLLLNLEPEKNLIFLYV
jgi:hypothetical protein